MCRCPWCAGDAEYTRYHDEEWGVPIYDSRLLFEFLLLEGAQAGLSWLTILKRRPAYRAAFGGSGASAPHGHGKAASSALIDPEAVARFGEADIERLMQNAGIIRNRLKIKAFITNSRAYLALRDTGVDFSGFIWSLAGGKPIVNKHKAFDTIPVSTPLSEHISKALKQKGFVFTGPVSVYAYMQAAGIVNDHLVSCFRYKEV
ncbi:MAG: DNA-3-methyladenine glycosylase I, partial [Spirochaetaceae bacterium]|nr:DNA-3-methyladenine glycosylase I [Spirochaetaceae bacterium]